jgi:tripartite ATP-independent transporter DctM subunit
MSSLEIGITGLVAVLGLIIARLPIGLTLIVVSFGGIWAATNFTAAWGIVRAIPFQFTANWSFSAVPMFLLMGYVAGHGGLTNGLFDSMRLLMRRIPGSLAVATVGATAMFSAASGSSIATGAAMSRIAVPHMLKSGYDKGLATGTVAASGTLGSLIPPSILLILYGIFTQQSIGMLFLAAVVPGVVSVLIYMGMIIVRVKMNPELAPVAPPPSEPGALAAALKDIWPLPVLITGVLGGIFAGVITPTEAGAIGALLATVIAVLRGSMNWRKMEAALRDAVIGTSVTFIIAVGASMFTSFMGLTGVPRTLASVMLGVGTDPLSIILMVAVLYVIMGMFIDSIGLMLLTIPVLMPLVTAANIDLIWFGIIIVKLLEIGLVTPPVGLNVHVISSALRGQVPLLTIFRGTSWFIAMDVLTIAILVAFPSIVLWLPSLT